MTKNCMQKGSKMLRLGQKGRIWFDKWRK